MRPSLAKLTSTGQHKLKISMKTVRHIFYQHMLLIKSMNICNNIETQWFTKLYPALWLIYAYLLTKTVFND